MVVLQTLIERLHAHAGVDYAFDDRVLLDLILCLAVGERNLVLRVGTHAERLSNSDKKEFATRVAREVAWICSTIFALSTHSVQCNPTASPSTFLRSFFIPTSAPPVRKHTSAPGSTHDSKGAGSAREPRRALPKRSLSLPLDVLAPALLAPKLEDPRPSMLAHPNPTKRTVSTDPVLGPIPFFAEPTSILDHDDSSAGEDLYPRRPFPERRRSSSRRLTITQRSRADTTTRTSPPLSGARTPPLSSVLRESTASGTGTGYSSTSRVSPADARRLAPRSPRTAFSQGVPAPERRASFAPLRNPRSVSPTIPKILRTPTDYSPTPFSTSPVFSDPFADPTPSTYLHPTPQAFRPPSPRHSPPLPSRPKTPPRNLNRLSGESRLRHVTTPAPRILPQVLILERLERARPSAQQALSDVLRERRVVLSSGKRFTGAGAGAGTTTTTDDGASMRTRRTSEWAFGEDDKGGWEGSFNLPKGFIVVAVVCEDHETGQGDGSWGGVSRHLFDRFSLSHSIPSRSFFYPSPSFHAPPLPHSHPLSPPSVSLLSPSPLPARSLSQLHFSDALSTYLSDFLSTLRHHPLLESRMLTARASAELDLFTRAWVVLSREGGLVEPRDVLAVVMSVVGHRLVMREPKDEKSMFWGSEVGGLERDGERRKGVEGVVRRVMGEV